LKLRNVTGGLALSSYDAIFTPAEEAGDTVLLVAIGDLHEFKNHPFKVSDNADMQELVESVKEFGVMVPGVARHRKAGGYEIIAGHRRRRACEIAGIAEMPMIVRDLNDDEATIVMADSNLQREEILPSEKAWALKMKLDAMKRQTGRRAAGTVGGPQTKSSDLLAEQTGESKNQIYRYIRLTELNVDLLDMVDEGKLKLVAAAEVSYLTRDSQEALVEVLSKGLPVPTLSQAQKLREVGSGEALKTETIEEILLGRVKTAPPKVTLGAGKLKKYFPPEYTSQQMENTIIGLLEEWRQRQPKE
jgi:ParB family chromosome partitioning protein